VDYNAAGHAIFSNITAMSDSIGVVCNRTDGKEKAPVGFGARRCSRTLILLQRFEHTVGLLYY